MRDIVLGITQIHAKGICHRNVSHFNIASDIKPQNLQLMDKTSFATSDTRNGALVKYADFGLATTSKDATGGVGSCMYLSPESAAQWLKDKFSPIDCFASDIYQVGLVLFEIFTG
jgi:serine/threonine protein kinase